MTTQLPPDYEDRHRLALTICEHLGINPQHVELGTLRIVLGPDHMHRITWTGHTHLNLNDLTELLTQANALHEDDHRSDAMRRDLAPDTGRPHSHPPDAPCNPGLCTGHPDWSRINRPT